MNAKGIFGNFLTSNFCLKIDTDYKQQNWNI